MTHLIFHLESQLPKQQNRNHFPVTPNECILSESRLCRADDQKSTHGDIFCSEIMTLVKKSKLTSCTSFKKSTKTSLLNMFGSMVTEKQGQRARLPLGWVDCSVKLLCPPGSPPGLASAPLPPWRRWSLWLLKFKKIYKARLLQAASQAAWTHHTNPADCFQESYFIHAYPWPNIYLAAPTRRMMGLIRGSNKI